MLVGRHEEKRLFEAYQQTRDRRARDAVIERFLPLAYSLARRYQRSSESLEDLEQVASLALVKAVERFDPSRDTAFTSYAVPSIAGAIKRHFRDCGWSVHVPRDLQELAIRIERFSQELVAETGSQPTSAQVAAKAASTSSRSSKPARPTGPCTQTHSTSRTWQTTARAAPCSIKSATATPKSRASSTGWHSIRCLRRSTTAPA